MQEPTPRSSRLILAASAVAMLAAGGAGFLVGRSSTPISPPLATPSPAPPALPAAPKLITPPPTLERSALLALVRDAIDDAAATDARSERAQSVAGRRFDLVLPFGCEGPADGETTAPFGWRYDPTQTTLRIWITPSRWARAEWSLAETEEVQGALEGFWIARPWSTATSCPLTTPGADTIQPETPHVAQEIAIARPIGADAGDTSRRLEVVKRIGPGDFDPGRGFHVRVIGRMRAGASGAPVRCASGADPQQRPRCIILGDFFELRLENPKTGDVMAVWPMANVETRD